jgi:hypothetical protein
VPDGRSVGPDGVDPTSPAITGLRVLDRPAAGFVDTIVGDVTGFFFGS